MGLLTRNMLVANVQALDLLIANISAVMVGKFSLLYNWTIFCFSIYKNDFYLEMVIM